MTPLAALWRSQQKLLVKVSLWSARLYSKALVAKLLSVCWTTSTKAFFSSVRRDGPSSFRMFALNINSYFNLADDTGVVDVRSFLDLTNLK